MVKASVTDAEPPENDSILTTETTQITVADHPLNATESLPGMKLFMLHVADPIIATQRHMRFDIKSL